MTLASTAFRREAIYGVIALICLVADQATKALAVEYLTLGQAVPFLPGLLDLVLVSNTGAAFSMGEGLSWLFGLIAVAVVVLLTWFLWVSGPLPTFLCVFLGVVAGGGLGNLVDRLFRGAVVDFFSTTFMDFPIFNVADIFVSVGIFVSLVGFFWWDRQKETLSTLSMKSFDSRDSEKRR